MKRANVLMVAGALLLILGVALVWVLGRDDADDVAEPQVSVLVARADLSAGQAGDEVVAAGRVGLEKVPASDAVEGALVSPTAMTGNVLATDVEEGDQLVATDVRVAALRSGSITIPDGKQAVAVTVDFTAGAAGYAAAGDQVNVYVNVPPGTQGAPKAPFTKLLLANVEVLDVSNELAPRRSEEVSAAATTPTTARTTTGDLTLLLALDAAQAEQVVFAASQNQLWFTVVPEDQAASTTGGVDYQTNYLEGS